MYKSFTFNMAQQALSVSVFADFLLTEKWSMLNVSFCNRHMRWNQVSKCAGDWQSSWRNKSETVKLFSDRSELKVISISMEEVLIYYWRNSLTHKLSGILWDKKKKNQQDSLFQSPNLIRWEKCLWLKAVTCIL